MPGYWRRYNTTDKITYCKNSLNSCPGDLKNKSLGGDDLCFEGHIGALCESCDIYGIYWGEKYSVIDK